MAWLIYFQACFERFVLYFSVCSCAEAIYCRHGESITACIRRSSYEYVFTTNHAQTQNSFERRPMASHKQSERQHFIPQTIPQLGVQNNGHFSQSRHPLNPSSILTFPTKQTETFMIHQDNNYIPSQYFSDASLSNLLSWPPHTPKHPHVLEYLFARPMSQLLGLKSPLHQLNKLPNQKESSETINVHAKNVFLNLNSNRVRPPSVFDSPEPLGSTAAHPPISLMAIFSKPENPYIYHSYLEALSNRPDEYFGAHEENSFVINPLLKVLFKFLKDQSKDGTFQHTKYVSLPLPPNMKPTESRWLLEPATSEPLKELSASNNSGKASLAVDTETKNTSGGNFYPFLRIDEYFATHENRTGNV